MDESSLMEKGGQRVGVRPPEYEERPDERVVLEVLEIDQLVVAKRQRLGRMPLDWHTRVLLWALRCYVVLMLMVVLVRVMQAMHGG